MNNKLPQHPESMDYDEYAYNHLRKYFIIGKFVISEQRTVISNTEYGKDCVVEKLDSKRNNTGIEFYVQNKSTVEDEKDGLISISIDIKNINYLMNKQIPAFIHLFHRKRKVGYWLWLQDWFFKSNPASWKSDQETVTIKFPVSQKLSKNAVKEIMDIVTDQNFKFRMRQATDLFNQINPNFRFSSPEFIQNHIFSIAQPKHENVQFNVVTDEKSSEAMRRVIEEGYAVQISIISTDLPSPFSSIFTHTIDQYVTIIPYLPNHTLSINIKFYNQEANLIREDKVIVFQPVRFGTKEKEYHGLVEGGAVVFTLIMRTDEEKGVVNVNFSFFCPDPSNPLSVKQYLDIYEKIHSVQRVVLTNVRNDKQLGDFEFQLTEIQAEVCRFVNAAYELKTKKNIHIPIPNIINSELLFYVEYARDLLLNGKSFWKVTEDRDTWDIKVSNVREIVEYYKRDGFVYISNQAPSNISIQVLDVPIDLGMVTVAFYVSRIKNIDEVEEKLADTTLKEQDMITTCFEIDLLKSFSVKADA